MPPWRFGSRNITEQQTYKRIDADIWVLDTKFRWICDNISVDACLVTRSTSRMGSSVWYCDDKCDELYDSGREIRIFQPCAICATQDLMVPDEDTTRFFDEHGMRILNVPPGIQFT